MPNYWITPSYRAELEMRQNQEMRDTVKRGILWCHQLQTITPKSQERLTTYFKLASHKQKV